MHLPTGAGVESSTLHDIPSGIYNGNGFNIANSDEHNHGKNGICSARKKIVIVGLGMVALSFMYVVLFLAHSATQESRIMRAVNLCDGSVLILGSEKITKLDTPKRQYDIVVIGEEPHVAYNRVGLTSFFEHREVEQLYLNPKEWVSETSSSNTVND